MSRLFALVASLSFASMGCIVPLHYDRRPFHGGHFGARGGAGAAGALIDLASIVADSIVLANTTYCRDCDAVTVPLEDPAQIEADYAVASERVAEMQGQAQEPEPVTPDETPARQVVMPRGD